MIGYFLSEESDFLLSDFGSDLVSDFVSVVLLEPLSVFTSFFFSPVF